MGAKGANVRYPVTYLRVAEGAKQQRSSSYKRLNHLTGKGSSRCGTTFNYNRALGVQSYKSWISLGKSNLVKRERVNTIGNRIATMV